MSWSILNIWKAEITDHSADYEGTLTKAIALMMGVLTKKVESPALLSIGPVFTKKEMNNELNLIFFRKVCLVFNTLIEWVFLLVKAPLKLLICEAAWIYHFYGLYLLKSYFALLAELKICLVYSLIRGVSTSGSKKRGVLSMMLNCTGWWGSWFGESGEPFHCCYIQVHSDLERYLLGSHLWVKKICLKIIPIW